MGVLSELVVELGLDTAEYIAGLGEASESTESFADTAQGKLASLAAGGFAVLGGAIATVGGIATSFASETNQSLNDIQANLGTTDEETAALGETVKDIFGNNFADSIDDAAQTVITLQQNFDSLGVSAGDNLQGAAEDALRLRDVFDIDVSESAGAATALMSEFGISAEDAYDFIAKGAQNGLNAQGDFLETIGEYSNLYAESGFSAAQFYSTLDTGNRAGVLGTDKVADSIKELGIRLLDNSDTTKTALKGLGLEEVWAGLHNGTMQVADAFPIIQTALAGIEDPLKQAELGVALFGTQWEDLGASAVLGISTATTAMGDFEGATESLDVKYNNLGSVIEGLQRKVLLALEPLGTQVLEIANTAIPYLTSAIDTIAPALLLIVPALQSTFGWITNNLPIIIPILLGVGASITMAVAPAFFAWAAAAYAAGSATLLAIAPLLPPILAVGAVVALVTAAWINDWGGIQGKTAAVVDFIVAKFGDFLVGFELVKGWIVDLYTNAVAGFNALRDGTINPVQGVKDFLTSTWQFIYDNTIGKVTEMIGGVVAKFAAMHPETVAKIKLLQTSLTALWAAIVVYATTKFTEMKTAVVEKATEIYTSVSTKVKEIYTSVSETFTNLLEPVRVAWESIKTAIFGKVDEAKTGVETKFTEIADAIGAMKDTFLAKAGEVAQSIIDGMVKGIGDGIASVANAVSDLVQQGIDAARGALESHSPSKVYIDIGGSVPEGFGIGVEEGIPGAIAPINTLTDASLDTTEQQLKPLPEIFKGSFKQVLDTTTKELGKLPGIFEQLGEKTKDLFAVKVDDLGTATQGGLGQLTGDVKDPSAAIGTNIIGSLDGALSKGAGQIRSTLQDIAMGALQAAKDSLGIASPSKAFMYVADMVVKGFLTVSKYKAEVVTALTDIMQSGIASATDATLKGLEKLNKGVGEAVTKIRDTFKELARGELEGSRDLSRSFLDVAEKVRTLTGEGDLRGLLSEHTDLQKQLTSNEGSLAQQKALVDQLAAVDAINTKVKEQTDLVGKLPQASTAQQEALQSLYKLWDQQASLVKALPKGVGDLSDEQAKLNELTQTHTELQQKLAENFKAQELATPLAYIGAQLGRDVDALKAKTEELAKLDPRGAADYFELRSSQLIELSELQKKIAQEDTQTEKDKLTAQLEELKRAQALELRIFEQDQQDRQSDLSGRVAEFRDLGKDIGDSFANSLADSLEAVLGRISGAMAAVLPGSSNYAGAIGGTVQGGNTLQFNIDATGSSMSKEEFKKAVEEVITEQLGVGYLRSLLVG